MANYGSPQVGFFLLGGYSLLGETTAISPIRKRSILQETQTLGDTWPEPKAVGVREGYFTAKGWYNDDAVSINESVLANMSTSRVACIAPEGNTIGKALIGFAGAITGELSRLIEVAKLHFCGTPYTISGEVDDGIILHALTAETATGDTEGGSSQDNTTSTANGGAGYLQVSAISGAGATLDARVRHSADDVSYVTLVTFTQVPLASTRAAERIAVAGTVNRHLASAWTIAGAGPSVTFMVGFARNP